MAYVTFDASATDPDGDPVTYEWADRRSGDYYALGAHTVRVRARDPYDAVSDWADVTFEITNQPPAKPVISTVPGERIILPGSAVKVTANATDPDGDEVTYIWEGRPSETYNYPEGRQIVKVTAVDAFGAESVQTRYMFLMGDPNRSGNLMLTGPDSSIREPGIEDATLIYYKFVVPPVDGHSGQDFGRVRGMNQLTGQWE
ncbi:PKD domain-containing protein [Christensenellaceae bacterium OttesenSCG-928-M15]|nr:PKD domain-containing protein [Christensenellaceae bacterium OttesenSCG-928-M15]